MACAMERAAALSSASLPPPHKAILGIVDFSCVFKSTLLKYARRGVGGRTRVCPNATDAVAEREPNACSGGFRGVPTPLKRRHDAVGDFNHTILVWRPFESDASNDRTAVPIDDREAM